MKKIIILFTVILLSLNVSAFQNSKIDSFTKRVDVFMKKNVKKGRVNYASIKSTQLKELNALVSMVGKVTIKGKSDYAKSFYINAYNILVISKIVALYPIASPLDHEGFFDKDKTLVAGEQLSLNELENKKIREVYQDPRIHFAVVCGAKGCPLLKSYAYNPVTLDSQLEQVAKETMRSSYFTRYFPTMLELSKIFSWYKEDFGGTKEKFLDFVNKYRIKKVPSGTEVSFYEYDWKLNDQK